ncbi:MAG: DUF433 domain-containing protein [Oscillatoria princeps RMCB-10]|jgi:uncharacterized protein (DUF433 family)|nr:DUF433 domain-containing protein [Oscillatoria princeps RMCB-10]
MVNNQLIDSSPEILSGTPVFRGTRVPVRTLIDYLAAGDSLDDFLDDFPTVSREQATELLNLALKNLLSQSYESAA